MRLYVLVESHCYINNASRTKANDLRDFLKLVL